MKFDASNAKTPTWIFPTTNLLLFGREPKFNNIGPAVFGGSEQGKTGVWLMPVSQVDTAVAAQKQIQLARLAQEKAQAIAAAEQTRKETEQFQKSFLAKYDRNHNGILDPEERERAKDDPDYVKYMVNVLRADSERANSRGTTNDMSDDKTP